MEEAAERIKVELGDRYRVGRELGRGGMGIVYLAEDVKHHRQVAIKLLRPDIGAALGVQRFVREIEIAARLTHPNILPLYDSGEVAGVLFYVMPFIDGQSLRDRLNGERQLPLDEAIQIIRELGDALDYAHERRVVHRDIKPENVLLAAGHPVITDFGIARAISETGSDGITQTGVVLGSPIYMSPEQAAGHSAIDSRTDVYALGCILYEMLAGDPPFTGSTPHAVLSRKAVEAPPKLRPVRDSVSEAVESVILKALARVPADRFRTCAEFVRTLDAAATGHPTSVHFGHRIGRRLYVGIVLVAIIVTGLLGRTLWDKLAPSVGVGPASTLQGELKVLSANPPAGTPLSAAELEKGVPIRVMVEHGVRGQGLHSDEQLSLEVYLMVMARSDSPSGDPYIGRVLAARRATWETRQLGLEGTVRAKDVFDGRVTLKAVLMFKDSSERLRADRTAATLIEYPVR